MDYKSILFFLDDSMQCARRLDYAIDLASRFGAHLTGLYIVYEPVFPYMPDAGFGELVMQLEDEAVARRHRSEELFVGASKRAGIAFDWQALKDRDLDLASARARTCDLVIAGQRNPDDDESFVAEGFPELVVLGAGRPALVLPYAASLPGSFRRVLVAWNGGREGARALADALPILTRADNVTVMSVESKHEERGPVVVPGVDVASYLSRHGVNAEYTRVTGVDMAAGEWLLSRAADLGSELIVAGAYGHGRMRELILGGVTRTLLQQMTVPVLMSH